MENKNILYNLTLKQANQSNALAYNRNYVASNIDTTFGLLDNAYRGTGKTYAKLKMAVDSGNCIGESCEYEHNQLIRIEAAPAKSLAFVESLVDQLSTTEDEYYDPNNNYVFMVANSIMTNKPGFSKTEGYDVYLDLIEDGSQRITFTGPMIETPLVINSNTLKALLDSNTDLISPTPAINDDMLRLLTEVSILAEGSSQDGKLTPQAAIADDFILKNTDGSYDYEIIDIGNGKGRNILQFDLNKIEIKAKPFINAEVSGLMSSEQEVIAAWNVFIGKESSVEEDDQMVQNANAGDYSWSYEEDLPLSQDNKVIFEKKYAEYFMKNYLKQFITMKLPIVEEDAAVFDLAEGKKAKAQKYVDDNNLN